VKVGPKLAYCVINSPILANLWEIAVAEHDSNYIRYKFMIVSIL